MSDSSKEDGGNKKRSLKRVRIDELANKHYHSSNESHGGSVFYNSDETTSYIFELENELSIMEQSLNNHKSMNQLWPAIQSNVKGLRIMHDATRAYVDPLLSLEFQMMRKREKEMALKVSRLEEQLSNLGRNLPSEPGIRPTTSLVPPPPQFLSEQSSTIMQDSRSGSSSSSRKEGNADRRYSLITQELQRKVVALTTGLAQSRRAETELQTENDRLISQILLLQQLRSSTSMQREGTHEMDDGAESAGPGEQTVNESKNSEAVT
jgi:hypothetical protein